MNQIAEIPKGEPTAATVTAWVTGALMIGASLVAMLMFFTAPTLSDDPILSAVSWIGVAAPVIAAIGWAAWLAAVLYVRRSSSEAGPMRCYLCHQRVDRRDYVDAQVPHDGITHTYHLHVECDERARRVVTGWVKPSPSGPAEGPLVVRPRFSGER